MGKNSMLDFMNLGRGLNKFTEDDLNKAEAERKRKKEEQIKNIKADQNSVVGQILAGKTAADVIKATQETKQKKQEKNNPSLFVRTQSVNDKGEKVTNYLFPVRTQDGEILGHASLAGIKAVENGKRKEYTSSSALENSALDKYEQYRNNLSNNMEELTSPDGKVTFGKITPGGYKAITNNTLDTYRAFNKQEEETISKYSDYIKENNQKKYATVDGSLNKDTYNAFKKYDIDPESFSREDFEKWADDNGYGEYREKSSVDWDASRSEVMESGRIEQPKKEYYVLEALATNNERRKMANSTTAIGSYYDKTMDSYFGGVWNKLETEKETSAYKHAGLNPDTLTTSMDILAKGEEKHPTAAAAGDLTGTALSVYGLGKVFSGITKVGAALTTAQKGIQTANKVGTLAKAASNIVPAATKAAQKFLPIMVKNTVDMAVDAVLPEKSEVSEKTAESIRQNAQKNRWGGTADFIINSINNAYNMPRKNAEIAGAYLHYMITGNKKTMENLSSAWQASANLAAAREGILQDTTGAKKWLWELGLGLGDNLVRVWMGGREGSMILMAGNVFSDTTKSTYDLTGDIGVSTANGLMQAATEYITEQIPTEMFWDALDNPSTRKALIKNILGGMGLEGAGEGASELIGTTGEIALLGDKSGFMQSKNELKAEYIKNGMSETEADNKALKEAFVQYYIWNPLNATSQGAFSGGIMQGMSNALGTAVQNIDAAEKAQTLGAVVINSANSAEEISNAVDYALEQKDKATIKLGEKIAKQLVNGNGLDALSVGRLMQKYFEFQMNQANIDESKAIVDANASDGVKFTDDILSKKGVSADTRTAVSKLATRIERTLEKTEHTITDVANAVNKITTNASTFTDNEQSYGKIFATNLEAITRAADDVVTEDFVRSYSEEFANNIKEENPEFYNKLSTEGKTPAEVLTETIAGNKLPEQHSNKRAVNVAATSLSKIIRGAAAQIGNAHKMIYGTNDAISMSVENNTQSAISEPSASEVVLTDKLKARLKKAIRKNVDYISNEKSLEALVRIVIDVYNERGTVVGQFGNFFNDSGLAIERILYAEGDENNAHDGGEGTWNGKDMIKRADSATETPENESDGDTNESVYDKMERLGLTYDEQSAILGYKSSESYTLNEMLREGKDQTDEQLRLKNDLNSALNKFPVYRGTVYRNIGFPTKGGFEKFIEEHSAQTVTYPAFTSSSKSIDGYVIEDIPYLVHYEIESISGKDVSEIGIAAEKEILFGTNTVFEILNINQNRNSLNITMREVNQNGKGKPKGTLENGRERQTFRESGSENEYKRVNQEIYSASNTVRGGSAAHDKIYSGTSDSNSERVVGGSGTQNMGGNSKVRDDSVRERSLQRIEQANTEDVVPTNITLAKNEDAIKNAYSATETPGSVAETEYNHLYDEEKVSKEYLDSVNSEIENAIISIRNGDVENVPDVIDVTELDEKAIKEISELVGFDVSEYVCRIEKDAIIHIENRHGINGEHDQSLSDPKDTARMGYVVNNSDSVDWIKENDGSIKTSKKYKDKNNKPAKLVMVQKKIDGTYCVSDVVPDSKNKTIWITSARIQKKHQDSDDNNVSPKTTPDNALSTSDNIISQDNDTVNNSVRTGAGNDTLNLTGLTNKGKLHGERSKNHVNNETVSGRNDISGGNRGRQSSINVGEYDESGRDISRNRENSERVEENSFAESVSKKSRNSEAKTEITRIRTNQGDVFINKLPDSWYLDDIEARTITETNLRKGLKTVFFTGPAMTESSTARGFITGGIAYIRVDHETLTAKQINDHEIVHKFVATKAFNTLLNAVFDGMSADEWNTAYDALLARYEKAAKAYIEAKKKINPGVTEYQAQKMLDEYIWEEMMCDLAGNIDEMSAYTERFADAVEIFRKEISKTSSETATGVESTESKASVSPSTYAEQIDGGNDTRKRKSDSGDFSGAGIVAEEITSVDTQTSEETDVRFLRDSADYLPLKQLDYQSLINKKDMPITKVDDEREYTRQKVRALAKENARAKGNVNNTDNISFVKNNDTNIDIIVGSRGINHGLMTNNTANAVVTTALGNYIENAIYINELIPRNEGDVATYVLLGYGESNKAAYPAYFIVNIRRDGYHELEEYGVLSSANAKKIEEASTSSRVAAADSTSANSALTSSTISIADLLDLVKNNFSAILPQSVLDHYGIQRVQNELTQDVRFSVDSNKKISLNNDEWNQFYDSLYELERGKWFPQTLSGDYIFETDNKLVFNDGNYQSPTINAVMTFDNMTDDEIEIAKESVWIYANKTENKNELWEVVKQMLPDGNVTLADIENNRTYRLRKDDRREGTGGSGNTVEVGNSRVGDDADVRFSIYETLSPEDKKIYDDMKRVIAEYGAIPKGAKPRAREIEVPQAINNKEKVSRFARTMMEAEITPDDVQSEFGRAILEGKMGGEIITDKKAANAAEDIIYKEGYEKALEDWVAVEESGEKVSKEHFVLGQVLYNQAMKNKDIKTGMKLATHLVLSSRNAGQVVQAASMIKKMTPEGQMYYIQKTAEKFDREAHKDYSPMEQSSLVKLLNDLFHAETDEERTRAKKKLEMYIIRKMSTSPKMLEKLRDAKEKYKLTDDQIEEMASLREQIKTAKRDKAQLERLRKEMKKYKLTEAQVNELAYLRDEIKRAKAVEKAISKLNKAIEKFKSVPSEKQEDFIKTFARELRALQHENLGIKVDEKLVQQFLDAKTQEERDAVYDKICANIAEQMPASFREKWDNWRYLAMLGNPRTHIRNVLGNAGFWSAVKIKNGLNFVLEKIFIDEKDRTRAIKKTKESKDFALKDFEKVKKMLQGQNDKYAITDDVGSKRKIWDGKLTKYIDTIRKKNFDLLELEDMVFLKNHYTNALASIITARKLDVNNIDAETLDKLRAYAIKEAKAATFRDDNAIAEIFSKWQRDLDHGKTLGKIGGFLFEGAMPFKKTPLNIAKQGLIYSPLGVINGLTFQMVKLKKGQISATEVIDTISKGLTGTGVMLLGIFLTSLGWLVGPEDENAKKRKFDKMVGEQSYALKIGGFTYTIDWMAPMALPLFVGNEIYRMTRDELSVSDIANAMLNISEPMLELSVFSGVSDAISSATYNQNNPIISVFQDAIFNYAAQALPTVGGQIARIVDPTKYNYYYKDRTSNFPDFLQSLLAQNASKIPGMGKLFFTPSVDMWGREETYGNLFERVVENLVSPGYYAEENYTSVDRIIEGLYERTGDAAVFPPSQQKRYVKDGEVYELGAEEYSAAIKMRGQLSYEKLSRLISRASFAAKSDEEKIEAIEKCYREAGKETKTAMIKQMKQN